MSVYMVYAKGGPEFGVDKPWHRGPLNLGDIAYEVLHLPDGSEWVAPCGTPDPCPPEVPHRYYRHLPASLGVGAEPMTDEDWEDTES